MQPATLKPKEAAKRIGISYWKILDLIKEGRLDKITLTKQSFLVTVESIEAFLRGER